MTEDPDYLAIFIREAGSAAKLLREHAPVDGRCPRCRSSDSAGFVKSPCVLLLAAQRAIQKL